MKYDLDRFLDAQEYEYSNALAEIKNGRKRSHWIWYIFPNVKGLGYSYESNYYGITCLEEAKEYIEHPILGARLLEITRALYYLNDGDIVDIVGDIDSLKIKSCMTLFGLVSDNDIFDLVLKKYYEGKKDYKTIELIKREDYLK